MRRRSDEWLLVPVFALPLLAAAALALWARHDYLARTEPFRANGETLAPRWIATARDQGRLSDAMQRFVEAVPCPGLNDDGWVRFSHRAATGVVRAEGARAPHSTMNLADAYPAGLTAEGLARPSVRISVEGGTAPGRTGDIDAGTWAFLDVIEKHDLDRLHSAPLPAATKLYLLRRVFDGQPEADERALRTLAAFQRLVDDRRTPLGAGAFVGDGAVVLMPAAGRTAVVYPDLAAIPPLGPFVLSEDADGDVRLAWSVTAPAASDELAWTGRLDAPFAGQWSFVLPHGERWWEASVFRRWALPAAVACLAFLLVPTALLVALKKRRRLDEARARFVNELAHDLRTPVTSLRLHAEMLAEGRVPKGEEPRYLDVLGRETARLSALLANLLDLSRLERGSRAFEPHRIEVSEALGEAVGDFALQHPKRADDVRLDVPAGLCVLADRTALARCLANLLDNAGKFTLAGTAIRVSAEPFAGAQVRIVVADEGEGIAPADRARVFDLYERGRSAAAPAAPGTGLGLALVRELVQGMGGRVTLLETPRGAAFEILLPEAPHG